MAPAEAIQTILVVEDDDTTRASFYGVLSEYGYQVALASNGREALDYLREHPDPDLIVLDMFMPGVTGWHLLRERGFHCTSIPVLIVTAQGGASDGWDFPLGVAGVVSKPVDMKVLLECVQRCLQEAQCH